MKNTKLIQLISTFSKTELLDFERHLNSLRLQKGNPIFKLFKVLKKEFPTFREDRITKERVYELVYGKGTGKNMRRLTDLLSDLNLIIQDYLINKKLGEEEAIRALTLLKIYEERKLDKLFFSTSQKWINKWEKEPLPGREYFRTLYDIYSIYYFHSNYPSYTQTKINTSTLVHKNDISYIINKLYLTTLLENDKHKTLNKEVGETENLFVDEILNLVENPPYSEIPHIFLSRELIKSTRTKNYSKYKKLHDVFINSIEQFSIAEQYHFILFLQYYCYQDYQRGNNDALYQIHLLNKMGMNKGIFLQNYFIADDLFRDIIQIGCAVKDFEWTENFISNYSDRIKEENKFDIITLSKAILLSRQNKYEEALQVLIPAKPKDVIYDIQQRCIKLQCFYELESHADTLYDFLNSFAAFISRNKVLSHGYKQGINNLIRFTYLLLKTRHNPKASSIKLKEKLENYESIAYRSWLSSKVEEIKNH